MPPTVFLNGQGQAGGLGGQGGLAVFTENGTFTVPAGVSKIYVTAIASGGNGEVKTSQNIAGDAGGGRCGEFAIKKPIAVAPENAIAITVGAGNTVIGNHLTLEKGKVMTNDALIGRKAVYGEGNANGGSFHPAFGLGGNGVYPTESSSGTADIYQAKAKFLSNILSIFVKNLGEPHESVIQLGTINIMLQTNPVCGRIALVLYWLIALMQQRTVNREP